MKDESTWHYKIVKDGIKCMSTGTLVCNNNTFKRSPMVYDVETIPFTYRVVTSVTKKDTLYTYDILRTYKITLNSMNYSPDKKGLILFQGDEIFMLDDIQLIFVKRGKKYKKVVEQSFYKQSPKYNIGISDDIFHIKLKE